MAFLVWVFAALGFFETGGEPSRFASLLLGTHWFAMAAAFAVPPLFRLARLRLGDSLAKSDRPTHTDRDHVVALTLLSGLAVALCLLEALRWDSPLLTLAGILALLAVYVGVYIQGRGAHA